MDFKIVTDSSANMLDGVNSGFKVVPLKIMAGKREYTDNNNLDVEEMFEYLDICTEKTGTSCPNVEDWLSAFGSAKYVFAVTISSGLSGSCNAATIAAKLHEEKSDCKVKVIDSLSAGPELTLIIEKLQELIDSGRSYEEICSAIDKYKKATHLCFVLKNLDNLARNGRVNKAVAKIAGVLNVQVVGKAGKSGEFEMTNSCRGDKKTLKVIFDNMKKSGYTGRKVRIAHCFNQKKAEALLSIIKTEFSNADIIISPTRGLCSFYAQRGGLMVGFEGDYGNFSDNIIDND